MRSQTVVDIFNEGFDNLELQVRHQQFALLSLSHQASDASVARLQAVASTILLIQIGAHCRRICLLTQGTDLWTSHSLRAISLGLLHISSPF